MLTENRCPSVYLYPMLREESPLVSESSFHGGGRFSLLLCISISDASPPFLFGSSDSFGQMLIGVSHLVPSSRLLGCIPQEW